MALSTFLEWAAKTSSRKEEIEHYLDDFLLAGRVGTKDCDFKCQVYGKSVRNFVSLLYAKVYF
jgi:hypothetical protein